MALTGKEKRALRAQGNSLKAEVWVGKEGVSDGIVKTLLNSLNTKELVKVKILEACPEDKKEVGAKLSEATEAELVQVLGNTLLFYKPLPEDESDS
ncbi:MAG: ribosome assembly RNA-binding protein YhbY [Calditrichia bacterium]